MYTDDQHLYNDTMHINNINGNYICALMSGIEVSIIIIISLHLYINVHVYIQCNGILSHCTKINSIKLGKLI